MISVDIWLPLPDTKGARSLIVPGSGISPVGPNGEPSIPTDTTLENGRTGALLLAAHPEIDAAFITGDAAKYNDPRRIYSTTEKAAIDGIMDAHGISSDRRVVDPRIATNTVESVANSEKFVEEHGENPVGVVAPKGHALRIGMFFGKAFPEVDFVPIPTAGSRVSVFEFTVTNFYRGILLGAHGSDALVKRRQKFHHLLEAFKGRGRYA